MGCPVWACREWRGNFFPESTRPSEYLENYSAIFNSVEGNNVFYGLPRKETVQRWAEQSREGFQFTFKFPRVISHELGLTRSREETTTFLKLMEPLAEEDRLGLLFLQLPPLFSPERIDELETFFDQLPKDFDYGLEVRHWGWYDGVGKPGSAEWCLNAMLVERGINRVHFDSRALFSRAADDAAESTSQKRKPQLPYRKNVTGRHPVVRFVGRNSIEQTRPWIEEWARTISEWVIDGLEPFIFFHAPSDRYAPDLVRLFREVLHSYLPGIEPLDLWPGERERMERPEQLSLM